MNIYRTLTLLFIFSIFALLLTANSFAQEGEKEKIKDSTDTTLVDGVKQIQKTKEAVENPGVEVIEENPDGEDVDLEDNSADVTDTETETFVESEKPDPRITIQESLTSPLYQPDGKRDPFKPFIKEPRESESTISETTPPIKRFPLDEYRIVGIVWVDNVPKAMVVDPEKNTYFLGESDEIGNRNGVILEVSENGLLVNEKRFFEDVFGEQKVEVKQSVLAFADEEDEN